jgi:hypothetical protein
MSITRDKESKGISGHKILKANITITGNSRNTGFKTMGSSRGAATTAGGQNSSRKTLNDVKAFFRQPLIAN